MSKSSEYLEGDPDKNPLKETRRAGPGLLGASQPPDGFYLFWNVLVPLSVLLNIRHFGLRFHELGLLVALAVNPFLLRLILRHEYVSVLFTIFLLLWMERVLGRWAYYKIYSFSFLKSILTLAALIVVPSLVVRYMWTPLYNFMSELFQNPSLPLSDTERLQYRDILMLTCATLVLIHSIVIYNQYGRGPSLNRSGRKAKPGCRTQTKRIR